MKQFKSKFNPVLLALIAATSIVGCTDEETTIIQPPTQDQSALMRQVFADYQSAMATLDSSEFGQVTDQMANSIQSVDRLYLDKLDAIDRTKLSDEDKIYYDTFMFDRNISLRGASLPNTRFGNFDIPITHFYNYIEWNAEWAGWNKDTLEGYEEHIQIVREFTSWVNNLKSLYSLGIIDGSQLPKVLVTRFIDSTKNTVALNDYAMMKKGLNHLKTLGDAELAAEYETAVDVSIEALKDLISFLEGDYYTAARGTDSINDANIGWGDLPNGQAWYQWQLDRNSTTGKSAMELSQLGEELVADAKAEMIRVAELIVEKRGKTITADWHDGNSVVSRTFTLENGNGHIDLNEFFDYLNSEQFFYGRDGRNIADTEYKDLCTVASSPSACEAALTDYNIFKTDANDVVAGYFKPIKADYTIKPEPAAREPYAGVASYGSNVFNLNTHPNYSLQKWNVSTLLLHEAAPGHHFQNAYATEYPPADKPDYIKDVWYTAYGEGWALYTEWLGMEMGIYGALNADGKPTFAEATGMCKPDLDYTQFQGGIYTDAEECNALQYFGSLNEAQLRNMRLAVDTGIHAKGWSIQEARDYMSANSALGVGDIESETFRYAAYVGQAVSYKSGFLVIKALLDKAQDELGNKFDWASFHDQLLKYGDQPMEVVETSINNWIKTQQ
ncbi:DUF885 domain-containing protein [Vibrio atypicus]|uniref:DUF885 domain-containing protein n=1 Tax=Vibrio atypicus TaxID=558271 RepID=UPI00135C55D7|nr:DUF885 domain-containing protein [Vibrio atypicus]